MRRGDTHVDVPQVLLEVEGVPVTMTVLDRDDERLAGRSREVEAQRARLADVEALLGTTPGP